MAKLTHTSIKNAKPKNKPYKLVDGGGMYLLVNRSGKYWRMNYRYAGKQKTGGEVENFIGKTVHAVYQDIYAKLLGLAPHLLTADQH